MRRVNILRSNRGALLLAVPFVAAMVAIHLALSSLEQRFSENIPWQFMVGFLTVLILCIGYVIYYFKVNSDRVSSNHSAARTVKPEAIPTVIILWVIAQNVTGAIIGDSGLLRQIAIQLLSYVVLVFCFRRLVPGVEESVVEE